MTDFILQHFGTCVSLSWLCMALCGLLTAAIADPEFRADVLEALRRAGHPIEATAVQIRMSRRRFSAMVNGHEPFTAFERLWVLPGFAAAFVEVSAPRYGMHVVKGGELVQVVEQLRTYHTRMLRMALRTERKRGVA